MKIVHLIDSMEIGGAEKLVSLLCRWQRQQGHDPSVHCLYDVGPLGKELQEDGFEIVFHGQPRLGGRSVSIYHVFKRCLPEVVHCHNATAAILGTMPARIAGAKRVVVTRHGIVAPPYFLRRELRFAIASRWCDWIVAVCERARINLIAAPLAARHKIVRIYNAAVAPHCNDAEAPTKCGFTLLHVARLTAAKDQETLLKAFAIARAHISDLRLWIVGGGNLGPKLENLAKQIGLNGSVTFFGEQPDISRFLMAADVFILSSISEGVPISLLEAFAAGVPAIVTDVGGISEVARLSDATVTAPPSNPAALAIVIEKMARSREQLPQLKNIARQCYSDNFTFERMATEYMALYTERIPV